MVIPKPLQKLVARPRGFHAIWQPTFEVVWVYALPGGNVECGESVEIAIQCGTLEEAHLQLKDLKQFHVYSDPERNHLFRAVDVAFLSKAESMPWPGGEALEALVFLLPAIPWDNLAFDHAQILKDYIKTRSHGVGTYRPIGQPRKP